MAQRLRGPFSAIRRKMKRLITIFGILCIVQCFGQLIQDESYQDESFWKFKIKLESCIIRKDTTQLKAFLAESIHDSNDGCGNQGCLKAIVRYKLGGNRSEVPKLVADRFNFRHVRVNPQRANKLI